ncbi:hypothetical protein COCMIDRAFT_29589 [Bipolaris oryzae ATCC 44560]|uniref:Secreted protein n=1 Tax=Bipolaris oryzae ATCC 44560 TaxID=930090 RepID=W6YQC8_COCMI|nr:uncharacterized protein COCMIDRAFT_29589 [Bipolaris oryzae ATCC 44560]EUC41647.1 hypothetical protein COCMIDRAFT_29589 [Bipolaris oryzae ATCC 44560]
MLSAVCGLVVCLVQKLARSLTSSYDDGPSSHKCKRVNENNNNNNKPIPPPSWSTARSDDHAAHTTVVIGTLHSAPYPPNLCARTLSLLDCPRPHHNSGVGLISCSPRPPSTDWLPPLSLPHPRTHARTHTRCTCSSALLLLLTAAFAFASPASPGFSAHGVWRDRREIITPIPSPPRTLSTSGTLLTCLRPAPRHRPTAHPHRSR